MDTKFFDAVGAIELAGDSPVPIYEIKILEFNTRGYKGEVAYIFKRGCFDVWLTKLESGAETATINAEHDNKAVASTKVPYGEIGFAHFYIMDSALYARFSPIQTSRGKDLQIGIDSGVLNAASVEIYATESMINFIEDDDGTLIFEYEEAQLLGAGVVPNPAFKDTSVRRVANSSPETEIEAEPGDNDENEGENEGESDENEDSPDENTGYKDAETAEYNYYKELTTIG